VTYNIPMPDIMSSMMVLIGTGGIVNSWANIVSAMKIISPIKNNK